MDFKQLKALVCIADSGSFTRAAQQCNTVQPALSTQIANLEEEVGAKLFVRSSQGVTLTETGLKLYTHAQRLIKARDEAMQDIQSSVDHPKGTVQIGCINSLSGLLGPGIIASVRDQYPDIQLSFSASGGGNLYKALLDSSLDMAILFKDIRIESDDGKPLHQEDLFSSTPLECQELFEEELLLFSAENGDKEGSSESISPQSLFKLPLLIPPMGHAISKSLLWLYTQSGQELHVVACSDAVEVIQKLVKRGLGHTLLASSLTLDDGFNDGILARRIQGYRFKRQVVLCCSPHADMFASARATKTAITDYAGAILPHTGP